MIAKALSHEPQISSWMSPPPCGCAIARRHVGASTRAARERCHRHSDDALYRRSGEDGRPDRVIHKGELILVEDKRTLMQKLGKSSSRFFSDPPERASPGTGLKHLELSADGASLIYTFDTQSEQTGSWIFFENSASTESTLRIPNTQSSLQDIFVNLVEGES